MNKRLTTIFNALSGCLKFADVGCDHGYIAKAMLDTNKAQTVIISDISAPSLKKAEKLLSNYMGKRAKSVLCDGLVGIDDNCDQVLIAGMGGEEIISILKCSPFLPQKLVLQPMKNVDKVRKSLLSIGYAIKKDFIFKDDKFYNLLVCEKGTDSYTEDEIFFGRDNLKERQADFIEFAKREYKKYSTLCEDESMPPDAKSELVKLRDKYGEII